VEEVSKPTPLQVAHKESGDLAPTEEVRKRLEVALAYARRQVTLKGVAESLGVRETQAYNQIFRLISTAIREGWLVERD